MPIVAHSPMSITVWKAMIDASTKNRFHILGYRLACSLSPKGRSRIAHIWE